MTNETSSIDRVLNNLRDEPVAEDTPRRLAAQRRRVVARLEALSMERAAAQNVARRWRRWGALALAATVVLSIGLGWMMRDHVQPVASEQPSSATLVVADGQLSLVREGSTVQLVGPAQSSLRMLDLVQASSRTTAHLLSQRGAVIEISPSTQVRFVPAEDGPVGAERIELLSGRIDVEVPEGGAKESFSVLTHDALVSVHGTRFSVAVKPAAGDGPEVTSVTVSRGKVLVRQGSRETSLSAGGAWTSATPPEEAAAAVELEEDSLVSPLAEAAAPSAMGAPEALHRVPAVAAGDPATPRAEPRTTTLADENRLFAAAMAAKRAGRDADTVRYLDEILAHFPQSSLVPNVRVERFRALQRLGNSKAAAQTARDYLRESPSGFAEEEARRAVEQVENGGQPVRE
jgi:hypothetical protein